MIACICRGRRTASTVRSHTSLVILARARDEAHRFANRAREKLGKAARIHSQLDDVPGIGPVGASKAADALRIDRSDRAGFARGN